MLQDREESRELIRELTPGFPAFSDTADRSHLHTSACVGFLEVVRSSDVVEGAESRFGVG